MKKKKKINPECVSVADEYASVKNQIYVLCPRIKGAWSLLITNNNK